MMIVLFLIIYSGEMSPAVKCRPKSIKKIKFGDELGHSLEEVCLCWIAALLWNYVLSFVLL